MQRIQGNGSEEHSFFHFNTMKLDNWTFCYENVSGWDNTVPIIAT